MTTKRHTLLLLCILPGLLTAGDLDISLSNALRSSIIGTWSAVSNTTAALARTAGNALKNYRAPLAKLAGILAVAMVAAPFVNKLACLYKQRLSAPQPEVASLQEEIMQHLKQKRGESLAEYIDRLQAVRNDYAMQHNAAALNAIQARLDFSRHIDQDHPDSVAEKQAILADLMSYQGAQRDLKTVIDLLDEKIKEIDQDPSAVQ